MLLDDLPTPSLILDLDRLERNCDRMIRRAAELGVRLRPHMKTAKSADVGRLATHERAVGVTVSTIAEAEYFAREGFRDITYAVGIAGHKVRPLAAVQRNHGARISLLADIGPGRPRGGTARRGCRRAVRALHRDRQRRRPWRRSALAHSGVCCHRRVAGGRAHRGRRAPEHGLVACEGSGHELESRYPVGTRIRVLPNHACLMAAPYDHYHLVHGGDSRVQGIWPKVTGWSPIGEARPPA